MLTGAPSTPAISPEEATRPRKGPFTRWPHSSDAVLAVVVFLLEVMGILGRAVNEAAEFDVSMLGDVPTATYLLLAASSIALLWRRRWPVLVLAATLGASVVWDVIGLADGPSLAILISLYGVGRRIREDRISFLAVGGALILVVVDDLWIEAESATVVGLSMVLVLLAWYLGRRIEARRDYLALVEERAEYLERERAAEAQRAVDEERTRIARELHDVVAHRVSLMTVQAGAAQTVAARDPDRALRAMEAVEEAGRQALEELRQVLGVLRSDESEALGPMNGLSGIPGLVEEMNEAGLSVSLSTDGVPGDLPARVDLASYRIVQEALTNVLKHAGPNPRAEVRLSADGQALIIEVLDRGSGVTTLPGSGNGLVGMRERAALIGGNFEAGPRVDGGFRIMARLPLERGP